MGKVTSRTALTTAAEGDIVHVVDVSDTTDSPQGTSKKATLGVIRKLFGNIYEAELSIPTAQVLALNGTPLEIVASPGAGKAIEVISADFSGTYNSITYTTNVTLQLITDTATHAQFENDYIGFTSSIIRKFVQYTSATLVSQLVENKALQVKAKTGNPAAGNSGIKVYVLYRIITV